MRYAIIGNSYAAIGAVEAIRAKDADGEIILFSDEPYHAYARPLISYFLGGVVETEKMFYRPADFYEKHNVECTLSKKVEKVDPEEKTITLEDGQRFEYGKLLVSSGSRPYLPPIKGAGARNVMGFKKWDDARAIRALGPKARKAIIAGGGLVGLKAAEGMAKMGMEVTIVSKGSRVLHLILDEVASDMVGAALRANGVKMLSGLNPEEILANEEGDVRAIRLENGEEVACDVFVIAKGVTPNVDFLEGTAVEVNRGVVTDRSMMTSVEDVYAAGDVAEAWDMLNACNSVIAIAPLAHEQGLVAGANMAGGNSVYRGGVSMNSIEVFKTPVMSIGITNKEHDDYEHESFKDGDIYRKLVFKGDNLIGALLAGDVNHAGILTHLIRSQTDVSEIKDDLLGKVLKKGDLTSLLPMTRNQMAV